MLPLHTPEQMRVLAETRRAELAACSHRQAPSKARPFIAAILRRAANRLDRPVEHTGTGGRPIRVLRLPTAELGNDRFIDVVIS